MGERREYLTAITARSDLPLRHALARTLPKASRTGRTFRAVCGASVSTVVDEVSFLPDHPRSCPACRREVGSAG